MRILTYLACVAFSSAVIASSSEPLPVVDSYTGPALPQSQNGVVYQPGSNAANLTVLEIINIANSEYQYNAITAIATPVVLDSTSSTVIDMGDVVTPPDDGGGPVDPPDMWVCGIPGWEPPNFKACGSGGFVRGRNNWCHTTPVLSCP